MITAKIVADSINPAGDRITTGLWTFPRYILCEINTHRMLAKNTASSRAIPVEKMVAAVREHPAMFEQYGRANKGMTSQELLEHGEIAVFEDAWREIGKACASFAEYWSKHVAKQIVNRIIEPWMWTTQIITGTDWHNFFALRAHPAAQPEFQVLAYRWLDAYLKSEPVKCGWGGWHWPFFDPKDHNGGEPLKISVARCARVSYTRHDAEDTPNSCAKLHDRLLEQGHMSPFEHQARATLPEPFEKTKMFTVDSIYYGCFKGWKPYRKFLPNENRTNVDLHQILANKPDWIIL